VRQQVLRLTSDRAMSSEIERLAKIISNGEFDEIV
jgi:histidine ammonia-lyase